jgi:hypothetical protein
MHTEINTRIRPDDARRWGFATMASIDNPKASKATAYGYLNAILYMAPSDSAGVGNLCPHSGACRELCLGEHSGQAAIRREDEDNATTLARKARARAYMTDREAFLRRLSRKARPANHHRPWLQPLPRDGAADPATELFCQIRFLFDATFTLGRWKRYIRGARTARRGRLQVDIDMIQEIERTPRGPDRR